MTRLSVKTTYSWISMLHRCKLNCYAWMLFILCSTSDTLVFTLPSSSYNEVMLPSTFLKRLSRYRCWLSAIPSKTFSILDSNLSSVWKMESLRRRWRMTLRSRASTLSNSESLSYLLSLMPILRRRQSANLFSFFCSGGLILPSFCALRISSKTYWRPSLPVKVDFTNFLARIRSFSFQAFERGLKSLSTSRFFYSVISSCSLMTQADVSFSTGDPPFCSWLNFEAFMKAAGLVPLP